mmetsp:Transcript_30311/g.63870  ORF Transcript_30311/g.63870 Transcript_30311/m.63870 type:complete len:298 (+) Transcript_30311:154-1047(+)
MNKTTTLSTTDDDSSISMSINENDEIDNEEAIIKKLSLRAYHLPGNSFMRDWAMYVKNNHLVFGICCHHRLHPVTLKHRLVILLGSLACGMSITNVIYLWHVWQNMGYDDTAFSLTLGGDFSERIPENYQRVDITHGMAMLWTFGSGAHSLFDLFLWHVIACGCCRRKWFHSAGWYIAVSITFVMVALTSFFALARAYETNNEQIPEGLEFSNPGSPFAFGDEEPDFKFLWGYLVELVMSLFVYTPIVQSLLFSGVLGCGVVPFLGGRPREVRKENQQLAKQINVVKSINKSNLDSV